MWSAAAGGSTLENEPLGAGLGTITGKDKMINCSNVRIDNMYLHVELKDGRILSTPLDWYPVLMTASETECQNYKLIARGTMIEWPDLNLHLDVEEMFKIEHKEEAA